jgi:hypothetical protein
LLQKKKKKKLQKGVHKKRNLKALRSLRKALRE